MHAPFFEEMLKGIDAANLKPRQKLVILQNYALPKLLYPLTQAHFPKGKLEELDVTVRTYVRKWLKLPGSTCNGVFHSSQVDGGLGLPEFQRMIPTQRIKMLKLIQSSSDWKIRKLAEIMGVPEYIQTYSDMAGVKMPEGPKGKATFPLQEWEKLGPSANGIKSFKGKRSNSWAM